MKEQQLLNQINNYVMSKGYTPIYNSVDEFNQKYKLSKTKLHERLLRAYEYFINDNLIGKGVSPNIETYGTMASESEEEEEIDKSSKAPKSIKQRPKQNFPPKEMSGMEEERNTINIVDAYSGGKSNARFTDKDWREHHQNAMKSLWNHTGDGWGISKNANMMKKDYLDSYVVNKPSTSVAGKNWSYKLEDMDNDGIKDVLVYDGPYDNPKSNLRYFNGYGWNQSKTTKFRNKYFTDDTLNNGDFSNDAFLTYYRDPKSGSGYKAPMKRPYDYLIKQFTDVISKYCSEIMKKSKDRAFKLEYNKSGFQGKLKSLCYRFVAIPAVLFSYTNNGAKISAASIQQLVFAKPDSKAEEALHRVMADRKTIKTSETLNDNNSIAVKNLIIPALQEIGQALIEHLKQLTGENAVKFIIGLYKDETNIDKFFYQVVYNHANAGGLTV